MNRESRNLGIGLAIGASAGIITGLLLSNEKTQQATSSLKSKITDLASDAQERIKSMKTMVQKQEGNLASVVSSLTGHESNNNSGQSGNAGREPGNATGQPYNASGQPGNTGHDTNNMNAPKSEPMASKYQKRGE